MGFNKLRVFAHGSMNCNQMEIALISIARKRCQSFDYEHEHRLTPEHKQEK
jgi:hypothetical protein